MAIGRFAMRQVAEVVFAGRRTECGRPAADAFAPRVSAQPFGDVKLLTQKNFPTS